MGDDSDAEKVEGSTAGSSSDALTPPASAPATNEAGSCICVEYDANGNANVPSTECGFVDGSSCMAVDSKSECKVVETEVMGGIAPLAKFTAGGMCPSNPAKEAAAAAGKPARRLRGSK